MELPAPGPVDHGARPSPGPADTGPARTGFTRTGIARTGPARVLESDAEIDQLLAWARRIAVLGIKPVWTDQPAYYVPAYAQRAGYEIIPVPVYFPEVTEILGRSVYRRLVDVPDPIDIVNVFRRPHRIPPHIDDIVAARPGAVWMQLGIRHEAAAAALTAAGIDVVQDRCLLTELQRVGR